MSPQHPPDVLEAILSRAKSAPTMVAVDRDAGVSYAELCSLARQIAGSIRQAISGASPLVLLALPPSPSAYAAMIGSLIAGGTFCPIHLAGPERRNAAVCQAFCPDIILYERIPPSFLDTLRVTTPRVDVLQPGTQRLDTPAAEQSDVAYVVFTSGSTGSPKGVKVGRRGFSHFLQVAQRYFNLSPGERWGQFSNLGHDLGVMDVFMAFTQGGTLVPLDDAECLRPAAAIRNRRISVWQSVPSVIELMRRAKQLTADYLASLRIMSFCGEPLHPHQLEALFAARPDLHVFNTYGTTETTGFNTLNHLTSSNYRVSCMAGAVTIGDDVPGWSIHLYGGNSPDEGEIVVAADFLRREYSYDRNDNRESIKHTLYQADSQAFTYDNLDRLTRADRGMLDSNDDIVVSDAYESFNMDLLGNFTGTAGGVKVNATSSSVTQAVNATNEITTLNRPNSSGARAIIKEPFDSLGSHWTQDKGTWSVSASKVNVDTLTSGDAVLLADPEIQVGNCDSTVTITGETAGDKAGVIFAHDGNNSYYAVVIKLGNSTPVTLELYKVTSGSWGSALATSSSFSQSTYPIQVRILGGRIWAGAWDTTAFPVFLGTLSYDSSTAIPEGKIGFYSSKTGVKFDGITVYDATARDPKVRRVSGLASTSLASGKMRIDTRESQAGLVEVDDFADDDYMVQFDAELNGGDAAVWVRYQDVNDGYRVLLDAGCTLSLDLYDKGSRSTLATSTPANCTDPIAFKVKLSGSSIKIWIKGTLEINATDSTIAAGGVAFDGTTADFDVLKIGYDNNADDDIDDAGDDLVVDEDFGGTSESPAYDHAGNLVDDGTYRYVYDAWNRLVKVQSSKDSGATTFQTAEFDGKGRRLKKAVTFSGDHDASVVYLYDGEKICETRDGSGNMVHQFIHGTRYIDELVMVRVKGKGDLYVHQDANWNVIGTTDLGGRLVERNVFTPYGELTVFQETGFGDRTGDGIVNVVDKPLVPISNVTGATRIVDLDFDGDYDSADTTLFNALPQGRMGRPGRAATGLQQPFAHQGLLFDPELGSYQNRLRQYAPAKRRFVQRDPAGLHTYTSGYIGNQLEHILKLARRGEIDSFMNVRSALGTAQSNAIRRLERMIGRKGVDPKWLVASLGTTGYLYNDARPVDNQDPIGLCIGIDVGNDCTSHGCQLCARGSSYLYCWRCKFTDRFPGRCNPCAKKVYCAGPDSFNNCTCRTTEPAWPP